jgi:peptide/nickel transport system permease protein
MKQHSKQGKALKAFLRNRTSLIGAIISVIMLSIAILAPWISPYDPLKQNVYYRLTPPEGSHLLGTDEYGRDVLSRVFTGARISFFVGIASIVLGMIIGTGVGMVAGYLGGKLETVIMRILDILLSFPDEVFGVMVMIVLGPFLGLPGWAMLLLWR